jgi:spore maturation protein CgeB
VLVAADGAEVAAHLDALTPERARALGTAAQRRVLAHHTYAHRAAQVDALLANRLPESARANAGERHSSAVMEALS